MSAIQSRTFDHPLASHTSVVSSRSYLTRRDLHRVPRGFDPDQLRDASGVVS
jgi:hypothetical protein